MDHKTRRFPVPRAFPLKQFELTWPGLKNLFDDCALDWVCDCFIFLFML